MVILHSFLSFVRVDGARIKEVGPDRACAEWLLRCGAAVKWDKGSEEWLKDYNSLPVGNYRLHITEIDATDSAVMHVGFPHFSKRPERTYLLNGSRQTGA